MADQKGNRGDHEQGHPAKVEDRSEGGHEQEPPGGEAKGAAEDVAGVLVAVEEARADHCTVLDQCETRDSALPRGGNRNVLGEYLAWYRHEYFKYM